MLTTELRNVKRDRIPNKKIYFWENQHHFLMRGKKNFNAYKGNIFPLKSRKIDIKMMTYINKC